MKKYLFLSHSIENPISDTDNYRLELLIRLPSLSKINNEDVTDTERSHAVHLKVEQQAAAEAAAEADEEAES